MSVSLDIFGLAILTIAWIVDLDLRKPYTDRKRRNCCFQYLVDWSVIQQQPIQRPLTETEARAQGHKSQVAICLFLLASRRQGTAVVKTELDSLHRGAATMSLYCFNSFGGVRERLSLQQQVQWQRRPSVAAGFGTGKIIGNGNLVSATSVRRYLFPRQSSNSQVTRCRHEDSSSSDILVVLTVNQR